MANCLICGGLLVAYETQIGSVKVDFLCQRSAEWGKLHLFSRDYLENRSEIIRKEKEEENAKG